MPSAATIAGMQAQVPAAAAPPAGPPELRAPITNTLDLLKAYFSGGEVKSGARVNIRTVREITAALACGRVLAECISTVPLKLYQRLPNGKRREATDVPLWDLFMTRANPYQDAVEMRDQIGMHLAFVREFFVYKNMPPILKGKITELIPFDPTCVTILRSPVTKRIDGYRVTAGGESQEFPPQVIWHMRNYPNWVGDQSESVVRLAREALGLALVTEETHSRMHASGVRQSGIYSVEGTLQPDQYEKLQAWVDAQYSGTANWGRPMILDRNAKFTPSSINAVEAQHLETRRFEIEEICRAFGVMPIMIGHYDKNSTYASAEQMFLAHAVHTARPLHRRMEKSADAWLLTSEQRLAGYYFKFLDNELLRGLPSSRADFYNKGITGGWLTRNDARRFEDLDPIDGLDVPLMPLNMTDGTEPPPPPANDQVPPADPAAPPAEDDDEDGN